MCEVERNERKIAFSIPQRRDDDFLPEGTHCQQPFVSLSIVRCIINFLLPRDIESIRLVSRSTAQFVLRLEQDDSLGTSETTTTPPVTPELSYDKYGFQIDPSRLQTKFTPFFFVSKSFIKKFFVITFFFCFVFWGMLLCLTGHHHFVRELHLK